MKRRHGVAGEGIHYGGALVVRSDDNSVLMKAEEKSLAGPAANGLHNIKRNTSQ